MPQLMKPPRLTQWTPRAGGKKQWYVFYFDHATMSQKRISCIAQGARTEAERRTLVKMISSQQVQLHAERKRRGGTLGYDSLLLDCIQEYEERVAERKALREQDENGKLGLSAKTAELALNATKRFRQWLELACPCFMYQLL